MPDFVFNEPTEVFKVSWKCERFSEDERMVSYTVTSITKNGQKFSRKSHQTFDNNFLNVGYSVSEDNL